MVALISLSHLALHRLWRPLFLSPPCQPSFPFGLLPPLVPITSHARCALCRWSHVREEGGERRRVSLGASASGGSRPETKIEPISQVFVYYFHVQLSYTFLMLDVDDC